MSSNSCTIIFFLVIMNPMNYNPTLAFSLKFSAVSKRVEPEGNVFFMPLLWKKQKEKKSFEYCSMMGVPFSLNQFVLFLYARKFFSLQKHSFSVWSHLCSHEEFVPVFLVGCFPRSRELDFIPQHGVAWKQEHHRARLDAVYDCTVTQQTGESTLTARPQHVLCMIVFYYIVAIISY